MRDTARDTGELTGFLCRVLASSRPVDESKLILEFLTFCYKITSEKDVSSKK